MRVAIVGAGVAGLTTALLMRDSGHHVTVFERADELTEVGAGIQLAPNGVRVLRSAGLEEDLRRSCVATTSLEGREWSSGAKVYEMVYGGEATAHYGAPYYLCHRSVLQAALRAEVGEGRIVLSKDALGLSQDENEACVEFADGSSITADVVIGADGIRSRVRAAALRSDEPTYSGMSAFRGNIPAEQAADSGLGDEMIKWWGAVPTHHMVMYRLSDGSVNFVAVVPKEEWQSDSWVTLADPGELRARFADFADPVPQLLDRVDSVYSWALHDREVQSCWSNGRTVLVGDSCHAMLPFLAQGAVQAIESAAVLARCLSMVPEQYTIADALRVYEDTRFARAKRVNEASRANGLFSSKTDPDFVDWLYRYDATSIPLTLGDRQ